MWWRNRQTMQLKLLLAGLNLKLDRIEGKIDAIQKGQVKEMAGVEAVKTAVADVEKAQADESARVAAAIQALNDKITALGQQIGATVLSDADAQALADRLEAVKAAADAVPSSTP